MPFQTRSAAESATEVYSSYEYRDVGITLKITPQISKGRLVRLNVFQELTKLDTVNQNNPDRPTTFKRQIETAIIVEDTYSVVIGGLIDETVTQSEYKTPVWEMCRAWDGRSKPSPKEKNAPIYTYFSLPG